MTRQTVNDIRQIRHNTLTLNLCVKDSDSTLNDDTRTMTNTHTCSACENISAVMSWYLEMLELSAVILQLSSFILNLSLPLSLLLKWDKILNCWKKQFIKLLTWQNRIISVQILVNKTDLVKEIVKILYYMNYNHVVSFLWDIIRFIHIWI